MIAAAATCATHAIDWPSAVVTIAFLAFGFGLVYLLFRD
jgi:hypothetical protein